MAGGVRVWVREGGVCARGFCARGGGVVRSAPAPQQSGSTARTARSVQRTQRAQRAPCRISGGARYDEPHGVLLLLASYAASCVVCDERGA